jgi:hypothetical protein
MGWCKGSPGSALPTVQSTLDIPSNGAKDSPNRHPEVLTLNLLIDL